MFLFKKKRINYQSQFTSMAVSHNIIANYVAYICKNKQALLPNDKARNFNKSISSKRN